MKLNNLKVFTEENKFCLLRRFLRQKNRELIDKILMQKILEFTKSLRATPITEEEVKSLARNFTSQISIVKTSTLSKTRINSDIESVEDFNI